VSNFKTILKETGIGNTGKMTLEQVGRKVALMWAVLERYALEDFTVCYDNDVVCYNNEIVTHNQPPTVAYVEIT
jgi:hypothetical protein